MPFSFEHPYTFSATFSKPVAYFCMEYAIQQPLKIYAGGLGFLAGSHLRSAAELKQNLVAIGILWKYGYYDQVRKSDQCMDVLFQEKVYGFLKKTNIKFTIKISGHDVWITAYYLPPEVFNTAPLFLLSTDLAENDFLAKTITHKLYDPNPETRIAASILLGVGGAKLFDHLDWKPDMYHLNESHALPLAFFLYDRYKNIREVQKRLVFTNHTPEEGGNPRSELHLLEKMGFFTGISCEEVRKIARTSHDLLDYTLTALAFSAIANGVSRLHVKTMRRAWSKDLADGSVISITNAQNASYWADHDLYKMVTNHDDEGLKKLKALRKEALFEIIADQNGEIFNQNILTIVFAKRFAGYKRADLLLNNMERFVKLVTNSEYPIQIIWAGKPYPMDYPAIGVFDKIVNVCKNYSNCATVVGYELKLSKLLKQGADIWLNTPRLYHEASGTSGMAAAMNGAINLTIPDGWADEFAIDNVNSFIISAANPKLPVYQQDEADANQLYDILEKVIIPMYYSNPGKWINIMKRSMKDILPYFDSNRMVAEYYDKLYNAAFRITMDMKDAPIPDTTRLK